MLIKFLQSDFSFKDDRGELIQLVHSGYNQVNYITANQGAVRGGHYHKANTEAFYVISGSFTLSVTSLDLSIEEEYSMRAGDFFQVPPNILHSFSFEQTSTLISLYSKGVENEDGSKDIHVL